MKRKFTLFSVFALLVWVLVLQSCKRKYAVPSSKVAETPAMDPKDSVMSSDTGLALICTTKKVKWAPGNAESILLDPQAGVIYPGSVIDASSFQDGKFTPITGDRKPIRLAITGPIFEKSSVDINKPNNAIVDSMINTMLTSKQLAREPSQTSISSYEIFDSSQLRLIFRAKYSGGTTKVEGGFNFEDKTIQSRYLLDVTQVYYSVTMDNIGPKDFFRSKPDNIKPFSPVYVSSIKYGRRILVAIESKRNIQNRSADLKIQFEAFASSGSLSSDLFSQKLFDEKSVKLLVMGGNPENAFELFKAVSNKDTIFDILQKGAVWSLNNTAFPIAYTVKNAYDNSVFMVAQYGEYVARACIVKPTNQREILPAEIRKLCAFPTGGDREFSGDPNVELTVKLSFEGRNIFAEISAKWIERGTDNKSTASYYEAKRWIASVGEDSTIISIESAKDLIGLPPDSRTRGYEPTAFDFDAGSSPIRSVSILGDTPDDDDPWPGDCGTNHSQITAMFFYPIKVIVAKTK